MRVKIIVVLTCVALHFSLSSSVAEDWPTWRHDRGRSASTSEQLADQLHLQWTRDYPALKPAWPEDPRLQFDANYEPVVMDQRLFLGSSHDDSVTAIETATGTELWKFFADGPVRFAPVTAQDRVFFGADDGCLYCLDANSGQLIWKHQAAPTARRVLGNERLISVWPVRGGPVLDNGIIYFTAGVWPFEGTFLVAVDAQTGQAVPPLRSQATDSDARSVPQDSLSDLTMVTLKDKTPQGYLAVGDSKILIPCGRSVVTCLDRNTGQLVNFSYSTSATTNYHVATAGPWLFHGLISFDMSSQETAELRARQPVLSDDAMYVGSAGNILAFDLMGSEDSTDRKGAEVQKPVLRPLWTCPVDVLKGPVRDSEEYAAWITDNPLRVDLQAGNRLYGHQRDVIFAADMAATAGQLPVVSWTERIEGKVASMIAADGKLFVVTEEGRIYCFGEQSTAPAEHLLKARTKAPVQNAAKAKTQRLLDASGARDGYCLVLGLEDGRLVEAVTQQSSLQIIGVDSDAKRVDVLRRHFGQLGLYGTRVSLHTGDPTDFEFPPYLANLIVSEDWQRVGLDLESEDVDKVFELLRPYGGVIAFDTSAGDIDVTEQQVVENVRKTPTTRVQRSGDVVLLEREGALPGAADWTHEYGDPTNALMSYDDRVQAPFGVLWFGGPAGDTDLYYNRHFWGPSLLVVEGRMFIQGPGKLTAVDIYTGRLLWQIPLSHNENYNPGRRGNDFDGFLTGFHLSAVSDGIYLVLGKDCIHLDPASGKELARFRTPHSDGEWGRIRIHGDLLIASIFRDTDKYGKLPVEMVGMNRYSGETRWSKEANLSFPVVAIGHEMVFCFDGALEDLYQDAKRRGLIPAAAESRQLRAWDVESGEEVWQLETDMIATWMGYSEARDVLVVSNKDSIETVRGCDGKELWSKQAEAVGFAGHPENLWDKVIIWNDRLIDQRGPGRAYDLKTGDAIPGKNPITDELLDWEFTREGHHCNYAIANPHLLTFRSDTAGFCDIETTQTSRLRGFRSGCRNSLIPAGGVLNAPNFAHGCVCGYAVFTSMGLVHRPQAEMWNYSALPAGEGNVKRLGINFGAPGDRLAPNGVLWLDYPSVGGTSPGVAIEVAIDEPRWFQLHSTFVAGDGPRWISASGLEGAGTLRIGLTDPSTPAGSQQNDTSYTVQLHFVEPTATKPGERVFDVELEGKRVLADFDIVQEAGGHNRALVKQFQHVRPGGELLVSLRQGVGKPVIAGVEIVAEEN